MTYCQLCSGFNVVDWVPKYHDANKEYPDDSSRYSHHTSFEDLEKAAAHGCDLCGLIVRMFKSVDGRDNHSWTWPPDLLKKQRAGHVSVYRLVKRLRDSTHTRVQMFINTSWLYGANTSGEPPVLDIVMVHVGPSRKHEREVPTLKLKLKTVYPSGDEVMQSRGHRIGSLPIDPYTGSDENFKLAKGWLTTCKKRHPDCLSRGVPSLPTRVIDVGDDTRYPDVRLKELEQESKAEYVALSHCWGGEIALKLVTENRDDFKDRIRFDDLAANFQDAIEVTRELGIRYLWIDSLCIIQDSTGDWETESKKMTTVYRDCTLTVSAMSSKKSEDGFLTKRPDDGEAVNWESTPINSLLSSNEDVQAWVGRFDPRLEEPLWDLEYDEEKKGPLARRGWTLQESVLSPRLLYYGANMIHWTCPSVRLSANGMRGMHELDKKYPAVSRVVFDGRFKRRGRFPRSKEDVEEILLEYYGIVDSYCARELTCPSDKFPALSGIAQRLQPVLGDYLAGLWHCDILRGLWWEKLEGGGPASKYRAPSWSWASVDGPVRTACPKRKGSLDVQMLDYAIRLADPSNPFGQVRWASLTLRGWTKRLVGPMTYSEDPRDGSYLHDAKIDEIPQEGNCHENREWSNNFGVFLPGQGSREPNDRIAGIGGTSWIKLGRYFVISGKYVILLIRAIPRPNDRRLQIYGLLLESVHGLRREVFKRVGTIQGFASLAALKKWQRREIILR